MIFNNYLSTVVLCTLLYKRIEAVSYSKVFIQQGSNLTPVDFVNYGSPPAPLLVDGNQASQVAQLYAAPLGSEVPLQDVANFAPCNTPCVVTSPKFTPFTDTKLLTYKASNVPSVVTPKPKEDPVSYQYSYVVYDENTGDQKAQKELSDGGVVRGEYSFMQPDGYVREVKYTADDIKGFNAIVKKYLPENADKKPDVDSKNNPLCDPAKNEALQDTPQTEAPKADATKLEVATVEEITNKVDESPKKQSWGGPTRGSSKSYTIVKETPILLTQTISNDRSEDGLTKDNSDSDIAPNPFQLSDLVNCLQASSITSNGQNGAPSPLIYVLLPNKKC